MIGENTNIGRRKSQPLELIEQIEPFEHCLSCVFLEQTATIKPAQQIKPLNF